MMHRVCAEKRAVDVPPLSNIVHEARAVDEPPLSNQ
jgi:hypothetical protein